METPEHTEPITRKQLQEYGELWPTIYINFVKDFIKPGSENSLSYSLFGLIEECLEFMPLIDEHESSLNLLLEAGDILYYAVLTSINIKKNDKCADIWPNFLSVDDSSKKMKEKFFNEYAKNQLMLYIEQLAKLGTKICVLNNN